MLIPYIYLQQVRKENLEQSLELLDSYDMPTGIILSADMTIEDCIDDEDGTLNF
jgi:hypothetical protein